MKTLLSLTLCFLLFVFTAIPASADIFYGFDNESNAKLTEGKAVATHSNEGYTKPGCISVSDVESRSAEIAIGEMFNIEKSSTYYLSLWAKPVNLYRCYGYVVVEWFDADGNIIGGKTGLRKVMGGETIYPIYTASRRPHTFESMPPVWMEYSVEMKTPENAVSGKVFMRIVNNLTGERRRERPSGTFLLDDISVTRSPHVEITTGEPGNLVIEGTPYTVHVMVNDVPADMSGLTISGGVYDLWGNEMAYSSAFVGAEGFDEIGDIPGLDRGFYEIKWEMDRGGKTIRKGTVATGIVPDPAERKYADASPFALDAGFSWFYAPRGEEAMKIAAESVRRAGLKDLRERMRPGDVNPAEGVFDWGIYERALKLQHDNDIKVLEIIHDVPEWMSSDENGSTKAPPKTLSDIYNFFKQGTADLGEYAQYWESWNEADGGFFMGRPEEFAGLQKAAYLGALAGNPDIRFTSLSYCTRYNDWNDGVFENGAKDYFDIFNLHFYGRGEEDNVLDWIHTYRNKLARFGVNQPWWMTEMGTTVFWDSTGSFRFAEILQAKKLVKSFVYNLSEGFEKYYYFYMAEFLEADRDVWGIFYRNLTPKPAFIALANLTGCLDKGEYIGRYDLSVPGNRGYVFHNGDEKVLVAWSDKPAIINLKGQNISAVDMMGAPVSPEKLGPHPIYIFGADLSPSGLVELARERSSYVRPDTKSLSLVQMVRGMPENEYPFTDRRGRKGPVPVTAGKPLQVQLVLCNFWEEPVSVTSSWNVPGTWELRGGTTVTNHLAPWEEKIISAYVVPGSLESDVKYTISVKSHASDRKIAPVIMWLQKDTR